MTAYYFDPDGGNNANSGLDFANRKKTWDGFNPGAGDEIRIMAARDPHSIGNASWTNGSNTITLAAAKTQLVESCDTNWTASTNVTAVTSTLASSFTTTATGVVREGSGYQRITCANVFSTGKVAYKALAAPLDLSAFNALSLWYAFTVSTAAVNMRLVLCSDAAGDTPLASLDLPKGTATGTIQAALLEYGASLPSGVNSIALYADQDPGNTAIFYLDNIVACNGRGHADHICHDTLIGKSAAPGDPIEWYPIRSLNGTAVVIGPPEASGATTGRTYPGTTETVATVCQQVQRLPATGTFTSAATNLFTVTGGWRRSDMAAQEGVDTFLSGGLYCASPFSRINFYCNITNVSVAHFTTGVVSSSGETVNFQGKYAIGMLAIVPDMYLVKNLMIDYMIMNQKFVNNAANKGNNDIFVVGKLWAECDFGPNYGGVPGGNFDLGISMYERPLWKGIKFRNNLQAIGGTTYEGTRYYFEDCSFENNTVDFPTSGFLGQMYLHNCGSRPGISAGSADGGLFIFTKLAGDENMWGYVCNQYRIHVQTSTVPTGETYAIEFAVGSLVRPDPSNYAKHPIATIFVEEGKTYSVSYEGHRSGTSLTGRVEVIDSDGSVYGASAGGAANTWVANSFSFTAAADAFVDITLGEPVSNSAQILRFGKLVVEEA